MFFETIFCQDSAIVGGVGYGVIVIIISICISIILYYLSSLSPYPELHNIILDYSHCFQFSFLLLSLFTTFIHLRKKIERQIIRVNLRLIYIDKIGFILNKRIAIANFFAFIAVISFGRNFFLKAVVF